MEISWSEAWALPYPLDMLYCFGPFELDLEKVELRSNGTVLPMEPQVFALLALLVENRERVVPKEEILERVWEGRAVSDSALASRIKSIRQVLGDSGREQRFVRTIRGQGFRFVAKTRIVSTSSLLTEQEARVVEPAQASASVSRPSIAVLPFRLVGEVGPYATIADGLPQELLTDLACLRWLFVVASGSSFRLRDEHLDISDVGRLLGVRYCLTGAVELVGRRLVVTTELIDLRSVSVIWAERYSGYVDEVHEMRGAIRASVVSSLDIRIPMHEASVVGAGASGDLDAWSAYHLGLRHAYRFTAHDNRIAEEFFRRAVRRDPEFGRAHAGLSFVHFQNAFQRQTDDVDREASLARSASQRAIEIDPLDPFANLTMGRSYWLEGDLDSALNWVARSTSLSPNLAQGVYAQAWTETMAGDFAQGREHADLAMKLSPLDPMFYAMAGTRAFAHLVRGEDVEGAEWAVRSARSPGAHVLMAMIAMVAQKMAGNDPGARRWRDNVRSRSEGLTKEDFFRAYPVRAEPMRTRIGAALNELGF